MNLTLSRDDLASAISRLASIVERAQTIPILRNVHLTATGDTLLLRSTNLQREACEAISANIETPGITTVDAAKLATLANSLPSGANITMAMNETRLTCSSGRTRIQLGALDPRDFPQLWQDEWPTRFDIDAGKLAGMISSVAFAQAQQVARVYLQGVYFEVHNGRLRMVATDSSILAYRDGINVDDFVPVTVPAKMIGEMSRLLAGIEGDVSVSLSETKIRLVVGGTVITSKLLDKSLRFPENYERVIPRENPNVAVLDKESLVSAINCAQIAAQHSKDVTVRLKFSPGTCAVTARNTEAEALDEIDADYDGPEVEMPLNPAHLLAIMATVMESVEVTFSEKKGPTSWRAVGDEDGLAVVMPQRVG